MTTVLVVSDTHGDLSFVRRILAAHPEVETLIHLGDHCDDAMILASEAGLRLYVVRGNGDFDCTHGCPASAIAEIEGHRLLLVHGHLQEVKRGLSRLMTYAAKRLPPVEVILFGHTHLPCQSTTAREDGTSFLLLNPGSARDPRRGFGDSPSSGLLLRIGEVEGPKGIEVEWA